MAIVARADAAAPQRPLGEGEAMPGFGQGATGLLAGNSPRQRHMADRNRREALVEERAPFGELISNGGRALLIGLEPLRCGIQALGNLQERVAPSGSIEET